nr:MAG: hypothetical protein J07AB56_12190 [Candidatus Nanosalinarum sp. J07AB56]
MNAKWAVARREVNEMLSSRKFAGVFVVFLLLTLLSVWVSKDISRFTDEVILIEVFQPLVRFNLPLAAAVLGVAISYNSVARERESGTLELLLSYPVYRDEVVNGKLIANLFLVSVALFFAMGAALGLGMQLTGLPLTGSTLLRLGLAWVGTVVYTGLFAAVGTMFSTLLSTSWRSLAASALVLLACVSAPLTSGIIANAVYPMDGSSDASADREEKRTQLRTTLNRVSPTTSYQNYVSRMLGSNFDSYDIRPDVTQTFRDTRGYVVYLLSETVLAFTLSYAVFTSRELD